MDKELLITKEDLVSWLDRPPSNDDLDLIDFITTRLENFYKLEQENKQLNNILTEIENMCKEEYYERNTIDIDSIVLSSHLDARIYLKIKELRRSINNETF